MGSSVAMKLKANSVKNGSLMELLSRYKGSRTSKINMHAASKSLPTTVKLTL